MKPELILTLLQNLVTDTYIPSIYECPVGHRITISLNSFYHRLMTYIIKDDHSILSLALSLVVKTQLQITHSNVFRLFGVAVVVATKFLLDKPQNNKYYSLVLGISVEEVNRLEINLLMLLDFQIPLDFQNSEYLKN